MAFKKPPEITQSGIETGVTKAKLSWDKALVASFLAGAYIAFGALLATVTTGGMDPKIWGTLPTFFAGAVFSVGLILTVIGGSELLTGNMALVPLAAMKRRVGLGRLSQNFGVVLVGNLLGALFVAYFLADQTGIVTQKLPLERLTDIAVLKGHTETEWEIFLRAVGCNWLVCLAVWLAIGAEDIGGKILAIIFPITGFVAMGFDHVVANMFFLPAAVYAHVPGITWGSVVNNWVFAFLGNFVGAGVFVAGFYWFLYLRGRDNLTTADGVEVTPTTSGRSEAGEHAAGPR
jgi:formate/nitrite transporter